MNKFQLSCMFAITASLAPTFTASAEKHARLVDATQERAYVGAGNFNTQLLTISYEIADPTQDSKIEFSFTPYFNEEDIQNIKFYLRAKPGNTDRDWDTGNWDLNLFDNFNPTGALYQRVKYLGSINDDIFSSLQSGVKQNFSYTLTPAMAEDLKLTADNPGFYIYVTADINPAASEFVNDDPTQPNALGVVINSVTALKNVIVYEKKGNAFGIVQSSKSEDQEVNIKTGSIATTLPAHDNKALKLPEVTTKQVSRTEESKKGFASTEYTYSNYVFSLEDQFERTRQVVKGRKVVFRPFDGYSTFYRIPGLYTASDGTLVLTADARKLHNHDCSNDFDVLCLRSRDNGKTWDNEPSIIAQGHGLLDDQGNPIPGASCAPATTRGYGDAAIGRTKTARHMVAAFISGHGFFSHGEDKDKGPEVYYTTTANAGLTWEKPKQIPQSLFTHQGINDYACPGPGRLLYINDKDSPLSGKTLLTVYQRNKNATGTLSSTILAYDETTDSWSAIGSDIKPAGLNRPSETQLERLDATTLLMTVRDDNDSSAPTKWYRIKIKDDGTIDNTCFTRLTEGGSTFGNGAGTCSSSFIVYKFTDGEGAERTLLLQSKPVDVTSKSLNDSKGYRSTVWVKYYEITPGFIDGTINTIEWKEGINMSLGQAIAGYSCLTVQADGTIGLAVEEYPNAYFIKQTVNGDPTSCATSNSDALLAMTYYNTTIENITNGEITVGKIEREIAHPTIDPQSGWIVPATDQSTENDIVYIYSSNGKRFRDAGKITVDPAKLTLADGDYYRISYYFRYKNANTDEWKEVALPQGEGNFTEDGHNFGMGEKNSSVTFNLRNLMEVAGRESFSTGDLIEVYARAEIYNEGNLTYVMQSETVKETYEIRVPARRLQLSVEPRGSGQASFEALGYHINGEICYYPIDIELQLHAAAAIGNEFVQYEVLKDGEWITLSQAGLLTPNQVADKSQRTITVPDGAEFSYDEVLKMRAVFKEERGGFHLQADAFVGNDEEITAGSVVYCTDPSMATPEIGDQYFPGTSPNFNNTIRHTTVVANGGNGIVLPEGNDQYENLHLTVKMTPDYYGFKRSAVVTAWYRDAIYNDNRTNSQPYSLMTAADGNAYYRSVRGYNSRAVTHVDNPFDYKLATGETEPTKNIDWFQGTTPKAVEFNVPLRQIKQTEDYYGYKFGYVVIYILNELQSPERLQAMMAADLAAANTSPVMLDCYDVDNAVWERQLAIENGEENAARSMMRAPNFINSSSPGANSYIRRIMLPIKLDERNTTTGVENVTNRLESINIVSGIGYAEITGSAQHIGVYDMAGRRVAEVNISPDAPARVSLSSGIYIAGGKKFIVY